MAQQTILGNSVEPLSGPNTGTGVEFGDGWAAVVTKLNANFNDLYGTGQSAGAGTATFGAAGNIAKTVGPVTSGNTNTSQTLASFTLPANTFNAVGQEIEVSAWGTVANNAAPKSIVLNVSGKSITTGTQTGAAYAWFLNANYINGGAAAQTYLFSGVGSGTSLLALVAGTDSAVDSGTIATSLVITDASAASNNVTLLGFTVEYFR